MSIGTRATVAAVLAVIVTSALGLGVAPASVVAGPKVTSFSPASGAVGTTVVVTGSGFSGASSVQFSGKESSFTVNSATQITATVPSGAVTGKIRVATAAGATQSTTTFVVTKAVAPTATGFSPSAGTVGAKVTVTGTGFSGATSVRFGSVEATYTVDSATQITATVPAGALSWKIRVANAVGAVQAPECSRFTRRGSAVSTRPRVRCATRSPSQFTSRSRSLFPLGSSSTACRGASTASPTSPKPVGR